MERVTFSWVCGGLDDDGQTECSVVLLLLFLSQRMFTWGETRIILHIKKIKRHVHKKLTMSDSLKTRYGRNTAKGEKKVKIQSLELRVINRSIREKCQRIHQTKKVPSFSLLIQKNKEKKKEQARGIICSFPLQVTNEQERRKPEL